MDHSMPGYTGSVKLLRVLLAAVGLGYHKRGGRESILESIPSILVRNQENRFSNFGIDSGYSFLDSPSAASRRRCV
ncbi:hypothetical protein E2C01_024473 [Portunus trituberculatus]|uniref:Uncharacterized protein n=1 Tax=Portunus trituberculatus TaxID=210409 RepID=A0A5B7EAR1_PORTR|nr:hypothetical protein [Portunus trituberculatus]